MLKKHCLLKSRRHAILSPWSHTSVFPFYKPMKFLAIISNDLGKRRKRGLWLGSLIILMDLLYLYLKPRSIVGWVILKPHSLACL